MIEPAVLPCRYGFHKEAAGGTDAEGTQKDRLLEIFGHWTDMVTDLIKATPEPDVMRRDIFDRPPIFKWTGATLHQLHSNRPAADPVAIRNQVRALQGRQSSRAGILHQVCLHA